jgi:hypothetical protein
LFGLPGQHNLFLLFYGEILVFAPRVAQVDKKFEFFVYHINTTHMPDETIPEVDVIAVIEGYARMYAAACEDKCGH